MLTQTDCASCDGLECESCGIARTPEDEDDTCDHCGYGGARRYWLPAAANAVRLCRECLEEMVVEDGE